MLLGIGPSCCRVKFSARMLLARAPLVDPRGNRRIKSYCCVMVPLGAWEPLTATKLLPPVAIVPPLIEKFVLLS